MVSLPFTEKLLNFSKKRSTGDLGERIACKFLRRKGLVILERNFRIRGGEIDIIAQEGDVTVFIEVKTRISSSFGTPGESIDKTKIKTLRKAALFYLKRKGKPFQARFDAINIYLQPNQKLKSLEWIKNAFPFQE